ncbi:MAG: hypothetical protein UX37_C0001G0047 [Microgenomates group bacterium GW2011_GWA2_46_16]|nr:MAG: hypothetical protein UX37_C0001G0047 [Microgenomates group bacterium GW2011_GWA2_46_16]
MTRAIFENGQLNKYLSECKTTTNLSLPQLAKAISVERHTLNDWRRGKLLPNLEKLLTLSKFTNIPLPPILETRPDSWGSSKAGLIRQQKYGCTFSIDDRVKGGHNSQIIRKVNPEHYRALGCIVANDFIFGYSPSILKRKECNAVNVVVTGVNFVSYLKSIGLYVGDKVRQQVDVPNWIKSDPELCRWCLRGLMDTDGGIFTNPYQINGKTYVYPKTCFTNASQPLLDFVYLTLKSNGFRRNNKVSRKIWLHSQAESKRYLEVIGSSNERLLKKIR